MTNIKQYLERYNIDFKVLRGDEILAYMHKVGYFFRNNYGYSKRISIETFLNIKIHRSGITDPTFKEIKVSALRSYIDDEIKNSKSSNFKHLVGRKIEIDRTDSKRNAYGSFLRGIREDVIIHINSLFYLFKDSNSSRRLDSLEEMEIIYVSDSLIEIKPFIHELRKGSIFFYGTKKASVTKVDDFSSIDKPVVLWTSRDHQYDQVFSFGDSCHLLVKEDQVSKYSELSFLNEQKDEKLLTPFIATQNEIIDVLWKEVDEATTYKVELYFYKPSPYIRGLYKMKTYELDKGINTLKVENCVSGIYLLRVIAEDRRGELICFSRGIEVSVTRTTNTTNPRYSYCKNWEEK
ncbi:hypothetical protein RI065_06430 [Mycoplasmatota bacterium zrk1]